MINKLFVSSFTIILFSMAGCLGGGGVTGEYPAGYPDIKVSGPLSIDESEIAAEISESSLKISFAVSNSKAAHFPVLASAKIASLDGSYEESREKTVVFSSKTETVDFDFTPLKDSSNAAQAGYVIKYEFRWGGLNYISGTRSLFMASPKTNIVLLAPENAYEGEKTHVKVFAQNPVTGKALPGTEITLLVAHPDGKEEVFSGKTDKFGAAAFETSFPLSGSAKLSATTKTGKLVEKVEGSVNVVRELRVLLTTDKPIYQPGQEMHLRSLALRKPDLLPEADKEAIFEVFDGKGNKVFREKKTTNDYGISYARFRLATEVNMGKYKISVTVGNTVSEKSVTVEKYVLPKFKVDVALYKAFYIVGDNLEGVVNAAYFFGKPVTGAAVAITGYQFDIGFTQFAKVEGAANDEGIFSFEMKLPDYLVGQALEQGKGLIKLDVEVKDTAGQYVG
ncbi:MAG: hypothetical protein FJ088_04995, partial [Deltaproteobacteria bacterium]|nr:hypothetical protein [Deltaproteobacteria bacterium]